MSRELLVAIHAGAGILGLIVGLAVFQPPKTRGGHSFLWRIVYGASLMVLAVSLVALIWRDWTGLVTGSRIAFTGLAVLAGVMVLRIYLAHRLVAGGEPGWDSRYVSHVYFTYISLWVGLAIIPAVRSDNPGLWIPFAVVAVLSAGAVLIRRYKQRIGIRPAG